ncbi:hypothetical protein EDC04DRAFT_1528399 [Pisolithus marmoratus]|nr:hypothetical protein EDC04DRAFT_1528399 [Pisolithus marmoratus]
MGIFGNIFQAIIGLFSGPSPRPEVPPKPARQQRPPVQRPQDQRPHRQRTSDLKVPSHKPFESPVVPINKQSLPQVRREGERYFNQLNQSNEYYVALRAEATREGDLMAQVLPAEPRSIPAGSRCPCQRTVREGR